MSFKIVQEIQKRGFVLVIIPEAFEENNVFWYPPSNLSTKRRNAIIKNGFAQPDKAAWMARPCKVKRKNIKSYEIAEQYEEELLAKIVTTATEDEADESDSDDPKTCRYKNPYSARSPQPNFEDIATECLENGASTNYQSGTILVNLENCDETMENEGINLLDISHNNVAANNGENVFVLQDANLLNAPNNTMWENIMSNQANLSKTQQVIINELNDIKIQMNNGFSKLFTQIEHLIKGGYFEQSKGVETNQSPFSIANFNKINCFVDAQALDNSLKDEEYLADMVSQMAYVVGKGGNRCGDGWTCCYELIDAFFNRPFLAQCSWTGASTSKEDGKIPFLSFKNIILCFCKIITNADPNFSLSATQSFFKSLLRNSTRFINQESSQTRKSSKRSRNKTINISKMPKHSKVPDSEAENALTTLNQDMVDISKDQNAEAGLTSPMENI